MHRASNFFDFSFKIGKVANKMSAITEFDFSILDYIHNNWSNAFLDFVMPKITFLGNVGLIWILAAVIMVIFKKYRKNGIMLAISLGCCLIIGNLLLKNIVARPRPCWINESVNMLISIPLDSSFPSGHTMSAFAAAAVIMYTNRKWGIAAYILAALIAFSRLYLYVHFPTDIIAGAVIGSAIGLAICLIYHKKIRRKA